MSYYAEGSETFSHRYPVAVDNIGGGSGAIDITCDLAQFGDAFWSNVQSAGQDVRAIDADGSTLLAYDLLSFNATTRTGSIRIDGYTAPGEGTLLLWLYWGNATVSTAAVSVTISAAKTGSVYLGLPSENEIDALPERIGASKSRRKVTKTSAEQIAIWWEVRGILEIGRFAENDSRLYEEAEYARFGVEDGGSEVSAAMDEALTRFVEAGDRFWIRTIAKAGADGTDYSLRLILGTTGDRILDRRAVLSVKDTTE